MIDPIRRAMLRLLPATSLTAILAAAAPPPAKSRTAWDFGFAALDGGDLSFAPLRGRVLLVVNTASFCGYTPQYADLEKLYAQLAPNGLTVIGVPSTDFFQESGDAAKVRAFCDKTYGVTFPMTAISHVRGGRQAPFYAWVHTTRDWQPTWNFNKVLIGRDGTIKGTYRADVPPFDPALRDAIAVELARPAPAG